jgi:hypothetical protein
MHIYLKKQDKYEYIIIKLGYYIILTINDFKGQIVL